MLTVALLFDSILELFSVGKLTRITAISIA